jgi:uncharacterized protein (DUF697 family)
MRNSLAVCNDHADAAIASMVATVVASALVPAHVNWAYTASAMGAGVVAIGLCYDVKLNKDEGWKLVKQFVYSAGFWFVSMNVGSKIFAAVAQSTGIGYGVGVVLDSSVSAAFAWAIGAAAKEYFQREYLGKSKPTKEELKKIFRDAFNSKKNQ